MSEIPDRACAECEKHEHCSFKWAYGPKSNCAGWRPTGCLWIHWSKEEKIFKEGKHEHKDAERLP